MSEPAQDVEVRLAEIDRRLREIQAELVPARVPRDTQSRPRTHSVPTPVPEPVVGQPAMPTELPPTDLPRGRAGPLAEALQRARTAKAIESSAAQPEPSEEPELPSRPPPPLPTISRPPPAAPQLELLSELQSSLLAATRDLLDGYERAASGATGAGDPRLTLTAGPFASTDALHAFEDALARLPGVYEVSVSAFEGRDHAILEVRLGQEHRAGPLREPRT